MKEPLPGGKVSSWGRATPSSLTAAERGDRCNIKEVFTERAKGIGSRTRSAESMWAGKGKVQGQGMGLHKKGIKVRKQVAGVKN